MYEKIFIERLICLRQQKNVSAREMSLAIGQNPSYINRIENGKAYPSMQVFFYICEYLGITPQEFWNLDDKCPKKNEELADAAKKFSSEQLDAFLSLIKLVN